MWEKLSKLRDETLSKLDTKKLELRVSIYSKELSQMYIALGKIYYDTKRSKSAVDEEQVEEILEGIDSIQQRIKYLSKHISEKKLKLDAVTAEPKSTPESKEHKAYAKLRRNQDDLIIKRTVDGIQFLRLCPECHTQINAELLVCNNCGYDFSEKKLNED